jgi:hypothetical protein
MIGSKRLANIQRCVEDVLRESVPGDFIEAGVWRGGAVIFMRGLLKAHGVDDRCVWAADSFQGLPPPDAERYPADKGDRLHKFGDIAAISQESVRANFQRYGLLDDQVRFLPGWFKDTLPGVRDNQWAMIRLDGDLYESTMDGLTNLYPSLSVGGYVIVDDYWTSPGCRKAVEDYRSASSIDEPLRKIDRSGVYWQRSH